MSAQYIEARRFTRWSAVAVLAALLAILPLTAAAEGPALDTIVSPDGTLFTAPEAGLSATENYIPPAEPEVLPSWYTLPIPPGLLPIDPPDRSVIGTDGRIQVTSTNLYPWRAVAFLYMTFSGSPFDYYCTGWFIGPSTVATAGHCVYDQGMGWATSITVYPGNNGGWAPYGSTVVPQANLRSVHGWTGHGSPSFDYGAMFTTTPMGNEVGWFGFRVFQNTDLGMRARITGYPADMAYGTMWTMRGRIQRQSKRRLFYSIDTAGGQSGSPVYGVGPYAVGIHAYGTGGDPLGTHNGATRINLSVFNKLYYWKYNPAP